MLGAIAGDIIGSIFEFANCKSIEFPLFAPGSTFTDDTVMTVATAQALLSGQNFRDAYQEYYHRYPQAGYGGSFARWAAEKHRQPYGSWGNGSAMRVSPLAYWGQDLDGVVSLAEQSAAVTHDHPEGIKGAKAVAAAIFLSRSGDGKEQIKAHLEKNFHYDLNESIDSIRKWYQFDVSCAGSVPQAVRAFYESDSFEHAVRLAVSIGGDSDTIACMAGSIAEAYYGEVPQQIREKVLTYLPADLCQVIEQFYQARKKPGGKV